MTKIVSNNKLLFLIVCVCVTMCTVSCVVCKNEKSKDEVVTAFQPDLYVIMALQLFSSQYGLPYKVSVRCVITNKTMTVQIFDNAQALIGKAVVDNRYSSREPELRLSDCVRTENSVPPEIVSLALLRGYERYGYCFKDGFSVYVEMDSNGYFVSVDDGSLITSNSYSMHIYRKNVMFGFGGR